MHSADAGHRTRPGTATDAADAINHFGQNILLSRPRPDGSDGTNELTYLCLNALEKLAVTQPVVTLRLHKGSPPELVDARGRGAQERRRHAVHQQRRRPRAGLRGPRRPARGRPRLRELQLLGDDDRGAQRPGADPRR